MSGYPQTQVKNRRLELLKRSGLFGHDTYGAIVQRAYTHQQLRAAYGLVHDAFVDAGYVHAHPSGMRIRIFEALPEMATFIALANHSVVGSLSLIGDSSDLGVPADVVFRAELNGMRAAGASVCEVTNQAVVADYRKSAVPTELMRCVTAHALLKGFDEIIVVVSPNHASLYRLMGFRQVGTVRSYSHTILDPVVALSMNLRLYMLEPIVSDQADEFIRKFMVSENPFRASVNSWEMLAVNRFLNADFLGELFVRDEKLLQRSSPDQLQALRRRWGSRRFTDALKYNSYQPDTQETAEMLASEFR